MLPRSQEFHRHQSNSEASEDTAYDIVPYSSYPQEETHPDRLCVIAALHGISAASPLKCRVLELGCGNGDNLIPMACELPRSEFVGVDLSRNAVVRGNAAIAELGLSNIVLQHRSIMDVRPEDGRFDYIIAHGVYSWVPQPVRDKILAIFRDNLAPQGVAYVSYNALPGAHLRDLVRSILLFHVRGTSDPARRASQSRLLMKSLAEASAENEVYGAVLRDQWYRINRISDDVFIHDDLDAQSRPFFLYQVVEAAARNGLQYLADASAQDHSTGRNSDRARQMLAGISESEHVVREQYADFIDGCAFRRSLFCRHDVSVQRPASPGDMSAYWIAFRGRPCTEVFEPADSSVIDFKAPNELRLSTNHRLSKAALVVLGRAWPTALAFSDLVRQAAALLNLPETSEEERAALSNVLFEGFKSGVVCLYRTPPRVTNEVGARPRASRLARWQAHRRGLVTNLLHALVHIEDETSRKLLCLLDGSRDLDELLSELQKLGMDNKEPQKLDRGSLTASLRGLASVGLLEAEE